MKVLYIASVSEEIAADSILDTASVAVRTLLDVIEYAKLHGLKRFKVTIEEIKGDT